MIAATGRVANSELISIFRARGHAPLIYDLTFPRLPLFPFYHNIVAVEAPGAPDDDQRLHFFRRFRQKGGHRPIPKLQDIPALMNQSKSRRRSLVFCDSVSMHSLTPLLALFEPRVEVVVVSENQLPEAGWAPERWRPALELRFERGAGRERYTLFRRSPLNAMQFAAIVGAAKQLALDLGVKTPEKDGFGASIWIALPVEGQRRQQIDISPFRFIHDLSRPCEGDSHYSWLWAREERQVRMLLGQVSNNFLHARLIIPRTVPESNLQALRIRISGRPVEAHIVDWGRGSGAVSVLLPDQTDDVVIEVLAPEVAPGPDGGKLSLCIDKIELS
jgi:hypothetical protein